MAEKIHSYYLQAEQMGGLAARAKLSILTTINSHEAKSIPDSEDTIQIFEKAMKRLVREFNNGQEENSLRFKLFKLLLSK